MDKYIENEVVEANKKVLALTGDVLDLTKDRKDLLVDGFKKDDEIARLRKKIDEITTDLKSTNKYFFEGVVDNITEAKEYEEVIDKLIEEKEVLKKELHELQLESNETQQNYMKQQAVYIALVKKHEELEVANAKLKTTISLLDDEVEGHRQNTKDAIAGYSKDVENFKELAEDWERLYLEAHDIANTVDNQNIFLRKDNTLKTNELTFLRHAYTALESKLNFAQANARYHILAGYNSQAYIAMLQRQVNELAVLNRELGWALDSYKVGSPDDVQYISILTDKSTEYVQSVFDGLTYDKEVLDLIIDLGHRKHFVETYIN